MFGRGLPCWFCVAKRHKNEISCFCSLEFQSVMQILTKCMLRWDTKTQSSRGKGILGKVVAFFGADEEQGCKTLHWHWQIWVQELYQTLQDCLFDRDATKRQGARKTFCQHIDNVISACYGPDFSITYRCIDGQKNEQFKVDIPRNLFREVDSTVFRRARHKDLYDEVKGGIMYCPKCKQTILTLLTRHCKDGMIVWSLVIELNITDRTQSFHYKKKD